jgi:integrase
VIRDADTSRLLEACKGKGFASLRDEALIRLYANTGARLSEVGNLLVDDVSSVRCAVLWHVQGRTRTCAPASGAGSTADQGLHQALWILGNDPSRRYLL